MDSTDDACCCGCLPVLFFSQLLLLAAVSLIVGAITAPAADWTEFTRYFKESRLVSWAPCGIGGSVNLGFLFRPFMNMARCLLWRTGICMQITWLIFTLPVMQIHVTSLDFLLLTSFAPFWLYNDMSYRKWWAELVWVRFLWYVWFSGDPHLLSRIKQTYLL